MKKIYLLLLTVFSAFLINAQTTVTIGAGTTTSIAGTNGDPIYRSSTTSTFHHSKSANLLTAAQVATAGLTSGATVTKFGYYKGTVGTPAGTNSWTINVYLKNSSATALASGTAWSSMIAGATLAYTATITSANMPNVAGYWDWTLTTPFAYTGGAIESYVEWVPIGTIASPGFTASLTWQYSATTGNQALGTSASATIPATQATYTTQLRQYNIRLTYTAALACTGTPNMGTATSTTATACSGQPFTLGLTGGSTGSGLSYQWQSSAAGANTFTNLGTSQTSAGYTVASQTAATDYQVITTCAGSGLSATSSIISVAQNGFLSCYCVTTPTNVNGVDIITNVTMGTLNNTSTSPANNFTTYNNTPVNLSQGTSQSISITFGTDGTQHSAVWIDFNQNGIYEASENVALSTVAAGGSATVTYSLSIPLTATLGQTRMRVRGGDDVVYSAAGACTASAYGETEDYLVNIVAPPACLPPTAPLVSGLTQTSANLAWTAPGTAPSNGYEWAVQTSTTPPASGTAATVTTAAATGLMPNTTYYLLVRSNCGSSFSPWVNSASFYTGYCPISSTSATSFIDAFSTSGGTTNITNTASGYSTGGYGDFTSQIVTQQQGAVINITGTLYTPSDDGLALWVDWNDNLVFEASERMYNSAAYLAAFPAISFTVPATAAIGNHRMRIVLDYNAQNPNACGTITRGEAEDYTFTVVAGTPCTGTPSGVAVTPAAVTVCGSGTGTFTATTTATGTGITYQWQSSPAGANTFTNISSATSATYTTVTVTASTDYQCIVTCGNSGLSATSNIASIIIGAIPANDEACGAITLVLDGATDCGNTTCATSLADPAFSNSTPNNTVWYKYTPTVTGSVIVTMARPTGVTTGLLNGWVAMYTATGTCPAALTFTELTPSLAAFNLPTTATVSATTPALTAGTTYYFMVDGVSGAFGAYCINIQSPPPPPNCTTNTTPVDMATNVTISPSVSLAWNAAATATSYDLYYGTTNPPTTLLGNTALTAIGVTGSSANTTYYWYVVPKNAGGAAVGCVSNVTSFTTTNICTPTTTNGGTSSDALVDFVLNGEGSTAISVVGAAPIATPGYIDLTASTNVDLAAGKAYVGNFKVQNGLDNVTIWIDYNNNNSFEASEMVLNNLAPISSNTSSPYSILISSSASLGTHKMRVRDIYNATGPIDPCGGYAYGEGKDFTVNIVASGAPYTVSSVGAGVCADVSKTTIGAASNNATVQVPVLDATGAIVAQLNANGNDLGTITSSIYRNTGAVRVDGIGQNYMDRNITITPSTQPVSGNVGVRLYYTATELTALNAADGIATAANLTSTKTTAVCSATLSGATTFLSHVADGTLGSDYYLDVQVPSFSTFYLKAGLGVLPIYADVLSGSKQGNTNLLDWKVSCVGSPSIDITLERSADGRTFKAIQQQNASYVRCAQNFTYADAAPLAGVNYYRVKVVTSTGAYRYTTIVALLNKDKGFELISLAPNPVLNDATLTLTSVKAGKINLAIKDIAGKAVSNQTANVIAGNNPINMNFATLGAGTYSITAINAEGEIKTIRFVKY
jgi:GEVED domain